MRSTAALREEISSFVGEEATGVTDSRGLSSMAINVIVDGGDAIVDGNAFVVEVVADVSPFRLAIVS